MKLLISLIFICVQIQFLYCQSDNISNQIIGTWYLEKEISDTLFFDKKSNLYGEITEDKKETSLEFHSSDSVSFQFAILEFGTFEVNFMRSGYSWNLNPKTKIIISDLGEKFKSRNLKIISIADNEMKLLLINKKKKASSQQCIQRQ